MPSNSKQGHRAHSPEKRTHRLREISFAPSEWALIQAAATTAGLRPGAFVGSMAVAAAKAYARRRQDGAHPRNSAELLPLLREVRALADETRELRRLLGNVSGNVNDIARHANSTHELEVLQADAVLNHLRRNNDRIDGWLMRLLKLDLP
ncbi:hypothetical protein [Nocardia thailandica]